MIKQLVASHCIWIKADHHIKLGEINAAQGGIGNNGFNKGIAVILVPLAAGFIRLFNSECSFFLKFLTITVLISQLKARYTQEITQITC